MIIINDKTKCCGCSACANICPKNCIKMKSDEEGFLYPVTNAAECVACGLCEKICPVIQSINNRKEGVVLDAFGGNTKDEQLRENSSSGGIFGMLAKSFFANSGVVVGAAFSDDFYSVRHICIETKDELYRLQGSKYLQSEINDIYKKVKDFLRQGRRVLFTGTPCQVAGLKAYLGKEYDNLFTQDVICHGTPSPMIWKKYAQYRECVSGGAVQRMSFRHKKYGWKTYSVFFEFSNNTEYVKKLSVDPYMQVFLHNIDLRPSCYDCAFKDGTSGSDIMLADYWGVQEENPELNDDKGTSLIIIHTQKGLELFQKIQSEINYKSVDFEKAIKHNPSYYESEHLPEKREEFFAEIHNEKFDTVMKKYAQIVPLSKRVLLKIKHLVQNVMHVK